MAFKRAAWVPKASITIEKVVDQLILGVASDVVRQIGILSGRIGTMVLHPVGLMRVRANAKLGERYSVVFSGVSANRTGSIGRLRSVSL